MVLKCFSWQISPITIQKSAKSGLKWTYLRVWTVFSPWGLTLPKYPLFLEENQRFLIWFLGLVFFFLFLFFFFHFPFLSLLKKRGILLGFEFCGWFHKQDSMVVKVNVICPKGVDESSYRKYLFDFVSGLCGLLFVLVFPF